MAAEAEAVAHRNRDLAFAGWLRRVVQIAVGIGRLQVDRRAVPRCCWMALTVTTNSMPPLAPSECPSWLLVLEMLSLWRARRTRA